LRAAREVFSERGYDAATFQAIAIRADLTRPAINHYFSNKRALYREVAKDTNELVVAASIRQAQRETTLVDRVSAFIDATTRADIENRTAAAFLITVALESQRHPELSHEEADSIRTTREFLSSAIDDAINRGELAADTDAAVLAETLIAVLLGIGFHAGFVASRHEINAVTAQVRQLLAAALAHRPN
jgi:TetR/AcrR family transcriptional regulator, repressor for uid operon